MPEKRIYQRRFDELFKPEDTPLEVTPAGFSGIEFPGREPAARPPQLRLGGGEPGSRFVREVPEPLSITSPGEAARYFLETVFNPFEHCLQEELWAMPLDSKNVCRFVSLIYRGNVNTAIVRPAEVFREAILANAPALILAHQHPSGDCTPSPEDVLVTDRLVQAGALLGIQLLDHLVIGRDDFFSLKEAGLGFK